MQAPAQTQQRPVAADVDLVAAEQTPVQIWFDYSYPEYSNAEPVFSVVTEPANGTLAGDDGDENVVYRPVPGFVGTDTFAYRVSDGGLTSNVATVTIQVQQFPGSSWESRTPESLGLDGAKLDQFAVAVGGNGTIVKDGYVVKSWGSQTEKRDWGSASKPVLSTMLFFAINEGRLSGVDALAKDWAPIATGGSLSPEDQSMTFAHLANMVSGYARAEVPGAAWAYNDFAISLYGKLLVAVFGTTLDDAATSRLAPLQLQDGSIFTSRGGMGISTSTRDFARIGWLWLNKGNWRGVQVLPNSFFAQYMQPQVPGSLPRTQAPDVDYLNVGSHGGTSDQTPYGPGIYGFNWWFNSQVGTTSSPAWPDAPPDTVQANGHWGKEMVVIIPSLNMVVSNRGNWGSFEPGNAASGINQNLKLLAQAALPPATGIPRMIAPVPGSKFTGSSVTFQWTADGAAVSAWRLRIGTKAGAKNLYDSGSLSAGTTSKLVAGLPTNGSTVHVTLRWRISGTVSEARYSYTAAGP